MTVSWEVVKLISNLLDFGNKETGKLVSCSSLSVWSGRGFSFTVPISNDARLYSFLLSILQSLIIIVIDLALAFLSICLYDDLSIFNACHWSSLLYFFQIVFLLWTTLFFSLISCVNHGTFFLTVTHLVISGALLSNAFLSWLLNAFTISSTLLNVMFYKSVCDEFIDTYWSHFPVYNAFSNCLLVNHRCGTIKNTVIWCGPQVQLVTSYVLPDWVAIRSMVFLEHWVGPAMCILKPIASNVSLKIPASSSEARSLRWIFTSPINTTLLYLICLSGNQFVVSSMNILFVIGALDEYGGWYSATNVN